MFLQIYYTRNKILLIRFTPRDRKLGPQNDSKDGLVHLNRARVDSTF